MTLEPVESGHIAAIGFEDGVMVVRFKNGVDYAYNVDEDVYVSIKGSDSIGRALVKCGVKGQRC